MLGKTLRRWLRPEELPDSSTGMMNDSAMYDDAEMFIVHCSLFIVPDQATPRNSKRGRCGRKPATTQDGNSKYGPPNESQAKGTGQEAKGVIL